MGVDISTYRGRIGCFSYQQGSDVVMFTLVVNFSKMMKYVGSVTFICLLLILAGIEQNPGPPPIEKAIYERALNKALPKLVGNLSLDSVLDYLLAEEILTRIQARDIKKMETSSGIRALICFIRSRGESVYTRFKKSLRETYQHGLLEYLEKIENRLKKQKMKGVSYRKGDFCEGSEPSQEKEDSDDCLEAYGANVFERALNKSMPKLVENLNLENVLDNLRAEKVLTTIQARDIKEEKNTSSRVRELIDVISTRGESAYISFKKGLRETHQHGLEEYLEEIEKTLKEQEIKGLSNKKGYFRKGSEPSQEKAITDTDGQAKSNAGFIPRTGNISISEDNDDFFEADDSYFDCFESDKSDVDSDTFVDAPGYQKPKYERRDTDIELLLAKLGLSEKLECKIKISDVVQVDIPETGHKETTDRDIPFIFLRRLLSGNFDAMNYSLYQGTRTFGTKQSVNAIYSLEEGEKISPLDLFLLVFHCCDPMLKQLLYQKLSLAKLALPFLYQEYPSPNKVLSVWPLRFLLTETLYETKNGPEIREIELLDLPAYVVSFGRFGRPKFSKSKLLNGLLYETGSETFFHKDRPLGMTPRYAACGYVEMFFVPFVANGNSQFDKPMVFLNVRGDIHEHFNVSDRDFITRTTDTAVVIFDSDTLFRKSVALEKHICRFSSVLLIFVSPLGSRVGETYTKLKLFEKSIVNRYKLKLYVLATHTDISEKNYSDIISETSYAISIFLRNRVEKLDSLRTRILHPFIDTDETDICKKAHEYACLIVKSIEQLPMTEHLIELVTPVQSFYSKTLGQLLKESYRNNDPSTFDNITASISMARQLESSQISHTVKLFSECLVKNKNDQSFLQFYLLWIKLFLDQKKRMHIKHKVCKFDDKVSNQEDKLESYDDRFLEIEHLLREVGHICDSILCSGSEIIGFPSVTQLGEVFADLVSTGQTLELLDGDNFLIPTEWIRLVLGRVHEKIERKQLLTLSVLGVQSSGKSTLLNTMFGLQFPASSGRCTRGIHMQLIPVRKQRNRGKKKAFEYILIIDTDGIRAPELIGLQETNYRCDNELSTIITGLGDHTILNVMGEGIIEMREILQILVHAFLRLKLTNENLDIHKSCFIVHQNVSDTSAPMKLKKRSKQTVKALDNSVKVVAEYEGISNITSFNEVIEFNPVTNVWYMPNLWQGNPPMATINRKYCERVSEMTAYLLKKSIEDQEKSYKSLKDIVLHVDDLWKGVLAENLVFSFRNRIETKAYIELEKTMKDELRKLDSAFGNEFLHEAQNQFLDCDDNDSLSKSKQEITSLMPITLSKYKADAEQNLETFFKINNYKEYTIRWKEQSKNRLNIFCQVLIDNSTKEINSLFRKREVDIIINIKCKEHEDELRRKSLELAKELRASGRVIEQIEKDLKFNQIWSKFVKESFSADTDVLSSDDSLQIEFMKYLNDIFESHTNLLYPFLNRNKLNRNLGIHRLFGSFDKSKITEQDICITKAKRLLVKLKGKRKSSDTPKEFVLAMNATENMFQIIDTKIILICKKNDMITSRDVKRLLHDVENLIEDCFNHKQFYTLTIAFKLKVLVHVSTFACYLFENQNLAHQLSPGIQVRLEIYRKQMQERFYAHLEERTAEDTAASLMHQVIDDCISEKVSETLLRKLKVILRDKLPQDKYYLILEILIESVRNKDLEQLISYIFHAKGCAYIWMTKKANEYLFSKPYQMYSEVHELEVLRYFEGIKLSLSQSCTAMSDELSPSIEKLIKDFTSNCKALTFPKECFRNVILELKHTEHVIITEFKNKIIEKLEQSQHKLLDKSKRVTQDTVRWTGSNPIDTLFEDLWGCPEQCLFCGEPCFKGDKHDGTTHNCLQHRPLGCSGIYDQKTGEILLRSCNLNVASDAAAPCSMINFTCSKGKRGECKKEWHPFKEYKEYLPDWDIQPSTNMEDSSKFWMWFIGKYKDQLGEKYQVDITNVPERWSAISDEKAIESLRKLYVAENV